MRLSICVEVYCCLEDGWGRLYLLSSNVVYCRIVTGAGSALPRYRAAGTVPQVPPVASPAQGGIPPPFRGFGRQPYQGQRSYGRGQPYHPYSRAPVQGRGCGRGRRGSDMY